MRDAGWRILASSQRAARVAEALLTTLGSHLGEPRRANVADLVRKACATWASTGGAARIAVELLTNAERASAEEGRIVVRAGRGQANRALLYAPHEDLGGVWAWITVLDTGCGMDQATLERAFEPYFTTKTFGAGAGLGLTKAYGIVHQNRGLNGIASRPGQGTTVTLYLPLVADSQVR